MAGIDHRRTISQPRSSTTRRATALAEKGHFVVYSSDNSRFVFPLTYLHTDIFRALFRMSEEEFGLPRDGPIILPCEAAFLEYVVYIIERHVCEKIEKALLLSLLCTKWSFDDQLLFELKHPQLLM